MRGVQVSVVLPAWREAAGIAATLAGLRAGLATVAPGRALELTVVDDGSDDDTAAVAEAAGADRVIRFEANRGKGAAVRAGVLATTGRRVVFTDADGQYPPACLLAALARLDGDTRAVVGRRARSQGPVARRLGSAGVSRLARVLALRRLPPGLTGRLDTQCGLKAFDGDVARGVFAQCRVDRFGFDVEVLALLARDGVRTEAIDVTAVAAARGSSVRMLRDGVGILADAWRIRRRLRRGDYPNGPACDEPSDGPPGLVRGHADHD